MTTPRPGPGPSLTEEQAVRIAEQAGADSGAPPDLLGRYVAASFESATSGARLTTGVLAGFRRLGQRAAERGVELPSLLDLYLSATWRLAELVTTRTPGPDDVGSWATALFRVSDDVAAALGSGYQEAQRRTIRREEAVRREFVDDLLGGRSEGEGLRELARQVGFNLAGAHRCVVVTTDRPLRDAGLVQDHVERALVEGRSGAGIVATKDGGLVCVVPSTRTGSGALVLDHVMAVDPGPWRVGVGGAHAGARGVARSFREAKEALDIARRLELADPVADFSGLATFRLLTQDLDLLAQTVDMVLGPLASARGGSAPLIETLQAYFDEGLSTTATARRLHLSVRAVTYRLERISTLTGRSLRDPHDRFVLETVVRGRHLIDE